MGEKTEVVFLGLYIFGVIYFVIKAFDGGIYFNSALCQGQQKKTGHLYFKDILLDTDISSV